MQNRCAWSFSTFSETLSKSGENENEWFCTLSAKKTTVHRIKKESNSQTDVQSQIFGNKLAV